jgi:putative phosphoesterase
MELAVIADVHSNLPALKAVMKEIGDMEIFSCGDIVGYYPYPNETLEMFRRKKIRGIMGNHDFAVVYGDTERFNRPAAEAIKWTAKVIGRRNIEFLRSLPESHVGTGFQAFHGSPVDPLHEYVYRETPVDTLNTYLGESGVLILAHTHVPYTRNLKKGLVLNPGSVGQPRDGDSRASYAVLDVEEKKAEIIRVSYDVETVAREMGEKGLSNELARRLYRGE